MTFPEFEAEGVRLIQGDCLDVMPTLEAGSVDLILSDLPYGTTCCRWDTVIPFEPLWACFKHVLKPKGAVVLTASQPFTSMLVMSNAINYKHHWVWVKERGTGFQVAKFRPMMATEDVIAFCNGSSFSSYNPQMVPLDRPRKEKYAGSRSDSSPIANMREGERIVTDRYPLNTICVPRGKNGLHPTQKPVALFEYLIRTYSNSGETVLDATIGSGTTAVAAINTDRRCVGIERDPIYFATACGRVEATRLPLLAKGTA